MPPPLQPDIQAINASFSALITAAMMCRLMLNLRRVPDMQPMSVRDIQSRSVYIGNLGEDLDVHNVDNVDWDAWLDRSTWSKTSTVAVEHAYELDSRSVGSTTIAGGT